MATYQLIHKTVNISTIALAVEIFIKLQVIRFPFLSFCPHNSHCHLQQLGKELRGKILPQGIKDLEKYLAINYSKPQGSILKYLQIVVLLKIEREKNTVKSESQFYILIPTPSETHVVKVFRTAHACVLISYNHFKI